MKNRFFFHKKWPLRLLTATMTSLLPLSCHHPDAHWLTEVCAGKDVNTREDTEEIFSALGQNNARALCFTWMLGDRRDLA
jgi:hypothetical protein